MRTTLSLFLTALLAHSSALKFLAYNPQFGKSHVNFFSKISDALIDAGHEVVMVSPRFDTSVGAPKTKARVIEVDQCPYAASFAAQMASAEGSMAGVWKATDTFGQLITHYRPLFAAYNHQCNATLSDTSLLQQLREEKFDAGFAECIDNCGYVLFHLLGIDKYATALSMALMDGHFRVTQTPAATSYVPSVHGGKYGDQMTFMGRLYNTFSHFSLSYLLEDRLDHLQEIIGPTLNGADIRDLMASSSLLFLNSDPLVDFPKITAARVIDIGGISVHDGHKKLDEEWSSVLDRRNKTVYISFGTWVKGYLMPREYKETIRRTIMKFPDVTFIWKYEKPEEKISDGLDNVFETTWAPQTDLLNDGRLTAFITHGGQGSITESASAGIPLICIPVTSDQFRNGKAVERNQVGVMVEKESLAYEEPLEDAIRKVINDESYRRNAKKMAQMIADRPFAMKEVFVRNMEFLAKYGPLNQLQHHGAKLSFVQYYLIDVLATLIFAIISLIVVVIFIVKKFLATILKYVSIRKQKFE